MFRIVARLIFVAVFAVFTAGCMSRHTEAMADVDPLGWHSDRPVGVEVVNEDTSSQRDVIVLLRCNGDFVVEPLELVITVESPNGTYMAEDYTLFPRQPSVSSAAGHVEYQMPYRLDSVLDQEGIYYFGFVPRAESDSVKGITAIGIKIVSSGRI